MKNIFNKMKVSGTKERFSFGLDIGTQSIKCVKLKINGSNIELVSFGLQESQLDPTEILKKIRHDQGADLVNISFCGASTVIRYVNFLRMNKVELKGALKFEAQKHIPFSVEEVNLDAEILKDDLPENKMLVLIAAIKKELVLQRIKILENAGLRANLIDIDSLALVNAFSFNYPKIELPDSGSAVSGSQNQKTDGVGLAPGSQNHKSVCLLNIGSAITNVNILDNGLVRLSRDIHSGGASFTKKIMDVFDVDFKTAEDLKINPTADKTDKARVCIENVLTSLASEIRTSFDYYESQNTSSVVKIFLSGGSSKISGLKEMLSACLGLPVETWDPFKQIIIPETIDKQKLDKLHGELNVAVGLALR
ncbi:MAG: type IV pilus assembly protein PilM [Candidatus Omnitrophica bacterium]|nr:type IV pilus assembly protein PilM [Candidatus Omnitrophota bacterium]